jgi:hypothetical protein
MTEEHDMELKNTGPNGRVIPSHSTSVDSSSAWDRTAQFKKMRSPATPAYFNDIFAFQLPNTKGTRKTHYSFIHHYVDAGGKAGAASGRALGNSVAVLNGGRQGTVLRGAARQGVYRHIAKHYEEMGRDAPELKSDENVDAIMMFKGLINAPLAETLDLTVKGLQDMDNIIDADTNISWFDGEQEMKGIVIEAEDDVALVEELNEAGERTGEFYEVDYAEMKLRTFVVMEKVEGMAEKGSIVSWDTTQGTFYGDVVGVETDGKLRGEPQGLELEGSEENPVYLIRVWMQAEAGPDEPEDEEDLPEDYDGADVSGKSAGNWHPTNVTVVARGDALKVEEALPTEEQEYDYDSESEKEESVMNKFDKDFRSVVEEALKANSAILERLAQYDTEDTADEVTPVIEEAKSEEVVEQVAEIATEVVEEKISEEAISEQATEEVVEEAKAEEAAVEAEPVAEVSEEKSAEAVKETASISFDDLKEFHLLIKEISQ